MTEEQLGHFYEASLTAGTILAGFIGTFLMFRIQREANYHRQPVLDFNPCADRARARDVYIGLSHFSSSFLLIIIAALGSMTFGVCWPLLALAQWGPAQRGPAPIVAGLVASLIVVAAYFVDELVHYRILSTRLANDVSEWKKEWAIVVGGVLLAAVAFCVTYCALKTGA